MIQKTASGMVAVTPYCTTCTKVIEEPFYCRRCKTPYHQDCLSSNGCLVPTCRKKSKPTADKDDSDLYSPLWRYMPWCWGLSFVAILLAGSLDTKLSLHVAHVLFLVLLSVLVGLTATGDNRIHCKVHGSIQ
jgi:hypothetical protein